MREISLRHAAPSRRRLAFRRTRDFDIPHILPSDSVVSITQSVDTLINRAIVARPELAEIRAEAEALAAQLRVARSASYPSLTISSNGGLASRSRARARTRRTRTTHCSSACRFRSSTASPGEYDVRSARERYEAGLARVQSTRRQIALEVFTSYALLRTATERIAAATELLASATLSSDGAIGRYREGIGTIIDVLLARSALATARGEFVQARWEWQTALAQLAHDVGSLDTRGPSELSARHGRRSGETFGWRSARSPRPLLPRCLLRAASPRPKRPPVAPPVRVAAAVRIDAPIDDSGQRRRRADANCRRDGRR